MPAGVTAVYPLAFQAPVAGDFSGSLELRIAATGERTTYALSARVGEPMPEGHLLLECQVGQC